MDPSERRGPPRFDSRLGWVSRGVLDDYDHERRAELAGRRPVLLFGDSFAACVTEPVDCWQGWFARSERRDDEMLLNYGAGGYGLDQIALLAQSALDRWHAERPRILIGILVDDDIDRAPTVAAGLAEAPVRVRTRSSCRALVASRLERR